MAVESHLTITVDGQPREIFMSFALLSQLLKLVGDPTNIALISLNPELREQVLVTFLADRTKTGKLVKEWPLDELAVSIEDMGAALDFIGDHMMDFTLAAVTKAAAMKGRNKERLSSLVASLIGPEPSPSTKPAA